MHPLVLHSPEILVLPSELCADLMPVKTEHSDGREDSLSDPQLDELLITEEGKDLRNPADDSHSGNEAVSGLSSSPVSPDSNPQSALQIESEPSTSDLDSQKLKKPPYSYVALIGKIKIKLLTNSSYFVLRFFSDGNQQQRRPQGDPKRDLQFHNDAFPVFRDQRQARVAELDSPQFEPQ